MLQTTFGIDARPSYRESDFLVADCNRAGRVALEAVRDWPQGRCVLVGPAKSGKTHLAHIWADHNAARLGPARDLLQQVPGPDARPTVMEDVHEIAGDRRREMALFDLVNRFAAADRSLLMTGRGRPADWELALPDLASRMAGSFLVEIGPPDDDLVQGLLLKQFSDRQVVVNAATVRYLARRCPRSYEAIHAAVMALDTVSLAKRQRISRTQIDAYFAKESL